MFLLVPAYPGCPGQTAVKWLLLLYRYIQDENQKKMVVHVHFFFAICCHHWEESDNPPPCFVDLKVHMLPQMAR